MKCTTEKPGCVARCLKIGLMMLAGVAVLAWIVMQLWNCLLPDLFLGVSPVNYWQALGLLVLSRILFGSLRGGCHGHWRERRAHWESLTPEERQQLKGRFRGRWSQCCTTGKADGTENNEPSGQ